MLRLRLIPKRPETYWQTTFQFQLANSTPELAGNSCTAPFSAACCAASRAGGEPPVYSNIRAACPPSPKADAHRPMVCGSRSSASAAA